MDRDQGALYSLIHAIVHIKNMYMYSHSPSHPDWLLQTTIPEQHQSVQQLKLSLVQWNLPMMILE